MMKVNKKDLTILMEIDQIVEEFWANDWEISQANKKRYLDLQEQLRRRGWDKHQYRAFFNQLKK